jgi:Uncharacterized protein conserved in bacteria
VSCPICARPAARRYRPFCSKRCADIDLAKWLGESYRVPSDRADDHDDPLDADPDQSGKPH